MKRKRKSKIYIIPGISHVGVYQRGEPVQTILYRLGVFIPVDVQKLNDPDQFYIYHLHFHTFN